MKLKYLGTGASEGIPSLYCRCPVCENARKKGGKDFRTRTGFILDDTIAIDFPPDSYMNMNRFGVDFASIAHLLISHTHEDHYYPDDIVMRTPRTTEGIAPKLTLYGNEFVKKRLYSVDFFNDYVLNFVDCKTIYCNQTYDIAGYKITPFYTEHMRREDAMVFVIQKDGKAYLHMVDSTVLTDKVYDFLKKNKIVINAASFDCTFGSMKDEFWGHMNIWQNIRVRDRLKEIGCLADDAQCLCTHISHYSGVDTYDHLNAIAVENGLKVAYDGLEIEF